MILKPAGGRPFSPLGMSSDGSELLDACWASLSSIRIRVVPLLCAAIGTAVAVNAIKITRDCMEHFA